VCNHSFSSAAILELLRSAAHKQTKCPAAGCNKIIRLGDLKKDEDLEKKVKIFERRQRRAQEEEMQEEADDSDEVIE
jgi:E3 SUMO-protein ligase NSE2